MHRIWWSGGQGQYSWKILEFILLFLFLQRIWMTNQCVFLQNSPRVSDRPFPHIWELFGFFVQTHTYLLGQCIKLIGSKSRSHILNTYPELNISRMCQRIPKNFIQKLRDLLHLYFSRCFLWTKSCNKIIIVSCLSSKYIFRGEVLWSNKIGRCSFKLC